MTFFDKMEPPKPLMIAKFNSKTHVSNMFLFFEPFRWRLALKLEKSANKGKTNFFNEPNQTSPKRPPPTLQVRWRVFSAGFPRGDPRPAEIIRRFDPRFRMAKIRGEGGVICGLI